MKKIILLATLSCAVMLSSVQTSSAQISTGESTSRVIKTGNRPQAGDWGLFVGVAYSDFEGMFSSDMTFEGFPLVNLKYYYTDKVELRLGLQFQGTTETIKGDVVYDNSYFDGDKEELIESTATEEVKCKQTLGTNRITPGIAYHFSNKNLLDVYAGATIPIGWNRDITVNNFGDATYKVTNTPFTIGLGTFIGLQAFVADLPLAIGLEYGISFMKEFGSKYKCTYDNGDGKEKSFTLSENSAFFDTYGDSEFEKLKTSRKNITNDIRLTISYYFNSGKK